MTDKQNYFTYTDNTSDNNDKIMENLHKQIIDEIDVAGCRCFTSEWDFNNCGHACKGTECKYKKNK